MQSTNPATDQPQPATPRTDTAPRTDTTPRTDRRVPAVVWVLVVIGLAFGAYQGVMAIVRAYVDGRVADAVGDTLVEFELVDLEGDPWRASDLRGKWVVLNFFRSRCAGCLAERDAVQGLVAAVDPAQVEVLGVLLDAVEGYDEETTAATLDRMAYRHPVVVADAAFVDAFHGSGWAHVTPITYVVDPSGRIATALRGHQTQTALAAALPASALR